MPASFAAGSSRRIPRRRTTRCPSRCRPGSTTWPARSAPGRADARQTLSEELALWRTNPRKYGKVSKKLAKQIAEGPPGPQRVAWSALETASAIVIAALARKAVERFLSGEPPSGVATLDAAGTAGGAAEPDPKHAKDDVTKPKSERAAAAKAEKVGKAEKAEYSGMSSRVP